VIRYEMNIARYILMVCSNRPPPLRKGRFEQKTYNYNCLLMVPSQVLTLASSDSPGETHFWVTVLVWV